MIESRQIRAARALLDWSQADLARAVGMATSSIKAIENQRGNARRGTLSLIRETFESNGLEFMPGVGVRFRNDNVAIHHGRDATPALLASIYETAHASPTRDVCIIGLDERHALETDGASLLKSHVDRLTHAGIRERILICEGDTTYLNNPDSYRWLPRDYFSRTAPIYIYGNKIAFHSGSLRRHTIIMDAKPVAEHLRRLFSFMWDHARVPAPVPVPRVATSAAHPFTECRTDAR